MRVECAWCKRQLPQKGNDTDDVTHTICLSCIDDVLTKAGMEARFDALFALTEQGYGEAETYKECV